MDLFRKANVVTLRSHNDKFLVANDDKKSVNQDRDGSSVNAQWTVELVPYCPNKIRFKSYHKMYLTDLPLLPSGNVPNVHQTLPKSLDSSIEWEPIEEGTQVKLKNLQNGNFLRVNRGVKGRTLPDWTHDPNDPQDEIWEVTIIKVIQIEDLQKAALVRYANASLEVQQKAHELFALIDEDKNDEVSLGEFIKSFEKNKYRNFFNDLDGNADGSLQFAEVLGEFIKSFEKNKYRNFFNDLDGNADGSLQFAEFLTLHYMLITQARPEHYEEKWSAQTQQPGPKKARGKKRAALKALWNGLRVAAGLNGLSSFCFDLFEEF